MITVGEYLVRRLRDAGVKHVFGVPGDYVLDFLDNIVAGPLKWVGTCNELNAGYAADGYARINGVSAVAVTYGVGGLSLLNAVAGAYAERVPMIVISGAPHSTQRHQQALMHHIATNYRLQLDLYSRLTARAEMLTDPSRAPQQIDAAIDACLSQKRPVYIELPVDMVAQPCSEPAEFHLSSQQRTSIPDALAECVSEAAAMLRAAKNPAVLVGVEVHRFALRDAVIALLEKTGYPVATTINGKTAIPEENPHYVGVYQGGFSDSAAHDILESADCVLCLGAMMTDITTGGFSAHLDPGGMINANSDRVKVRHHYYDGVYLGHFISALTVAMPAADPAAHSHSPAPYAVTGKYAPDAAAPMTAKRFFERMGHFLTDDMTAVCDTGDVLFGVSELHRNKDASFIAQGYYLSIGYSVPAALGVTLANPQRRTVIFTGDGAFQMTAQEISTHIRCGLSPIIFVLNNDGYAIERLIHDGPYNEILKWNYHLAPEFFGSGMGFEVKTEGDLEAALSAANANPDKLVFIEVTVPRNDYTPTLQRVGDKIRNLQAEKK